MRIIASLAFLMTAFISGAQAQDEGLYDPAPSVRAAYVRIINPSLATVNDRAYADTAGIGPYVPVESGALELSTGGAELKTPIDAGKWHTVFVHDGAPVMLTDMAPDDPLKAVIAFYNLSDRAGIALKTDDGSLTIIPETASHMAGYRPVNETNAHVALYDGATKLADIGAITPQRRRITGIVYDGARAYAAQATIDLAP